MLVFFRVFVDHALKIIYEVKFSLRFVIYIAFYEITGLVTGYTDATFNIVGTQSQDSTNAIFTKFSS